jgi:hypothetical protein
VDAIRALQTSEDELARIGRRARERTLDEHTAANRAAELERLIGDAKGAAPARARRTVGVA